jgi:hypothetical protein
VVSKFPGQVVEAHAELFLLPLVMRLVNDPSPKGRSAVADALKALLAALPPAQHNTFATFCKQASFHHLYIYTSCSGLPVGCMSILLKQHLSTHKQQLRMLHCVASRCTAPPSYTTCVYRWN